MNHVEAQLANGEPLDVQDCARLIVGSFRFSRGSDVLQQQITQFAVSTFPGMLLTENLRAAYPIVHQAAQGYVANPNHPPIGETLSLAAVEQEVRRQGWRFVEEASRIPRQNPDMSQLLQGLLNVDVSHLPYRQGSKWGDKPQPLPYKSNFVRYGLMGQSTGSPIFNTMFERATEYYWQTTETDAWQAHRLSEVLCRVVAGHLAYNDEDRKPLSQAVSALRHITV